MSEGANLPALSLNELRTALAIEREAGHRIVFTNGVFDLIHPGHVRYLREARSYGDVLVVGLNSDVSVRRLKGNQRPILSESERTKILAALEMVDYVALFSEDTPLDLIKVVQPDVLVKGGDYELNQIVGRKEVESAGGKVVTMPFISGKSSSNVLERIVASGKTITRTGT